jgi:hypothetical protein
VITREITRVHGKTKSEGEKANTAGKKHDGATCDDERAPEHDKLQCFLSQGGVEGLFPAGVIDGPGNLCFVAGG